MAKSRVIATGDGSTTQFAVSFALGYLSEDDIQCRVNNEEDGFGDPVYRSITFINPGLIEVGGAVPANGVRVEFTRTMDSEALLVDWENSAVINDDNMNLAQKQALMLIHQLLDGRFDQFANDIDMGGFRVTNLGDPTDDGDAVPLSYILDNALDAGAAATSAAASAAAALASANAADSSADAAAASEASVDADATAAIAAAASASASQSSASSSASTATGAASTATTQAGNAATSAAAAATSATAANTAKVAAELAETNAETAQSAAESAKTDAQAAQALAETALASTLSAYDSFDDRYLGSKTSNPTLDNDGNALVGGALYYNSVAGEMRLWTGAVWVAAYVSGGGFLATSGGTMTGDITLAGDPSSALHPATKQYVDLRLLRSGGTMTGQLVGKASDTASAPYNIPPGSAPTSPANGDLWATSADLVVRIGGVSYKVNTLEGAQTISGVKTFSAKLTTTLSGTGGAMFILPHGAAPSSPVDGDVWTTSASGLFARINGTTLNFQSKFTTLSGYGITDAAAKAQQNEAISGYILAPTAKDYRIVLKIPHAGTITNITTRCESGTCTLTGKVNTTALGGSANSVSSTEQNQSHGATNTFAVDDDIVLTLSSISSCVGLSFTIEYSRNMD